MRKKPIFLVFLFVVFLHFALAAQADVVLQWEDVLNGNYMSENCTLSVQRDGNTITIDGGSSGCEIQNIQMDSRQDGTSFGPGTYIFKNLTLTGSLEITSERNQLYRLKLESSVNAENCTIRLDAGAIIARKNETPIYFSDGDIDAEIFCDTLKIVANAAQESKLALVNKGNTGGLSSEISSASEGSIQNHGKISGRILLQADGSSSVDWVNHGSCDWIYAWGFDGAHIRFVNNAVVGMVATGAESGADVCFVNNGTITNTEPIDAAYDGNEWGDYAVVIDIDDESRLEFSGSGVICPGRQMNGSSEPVAGPSVAYDIHGLEVSHVLEENEAGIREIASHVSFNWEQVEKVDGASWIVAVYREWDDGNCNQLQVRLFPASAPEQTPDSPQKGEIVSGEHAFDALSPVKTPTIVFPSGAATPLDLTLEFYDVDVSEENRVEYDVQLINSQGKKVKLPAECILCFPYPEGLDKDSMRPYRITIRHYYSEKDVETFSTEDGTIELTKQGLCIRVSSLSPFVIEWEEQPEVDLPRTGDSSRIGLWFSMLALAGVVLTALKRKTA